MVAAAEEVNVAVAAVDPSKEEKPIPPHILALNDSEKAVLENLKTIDDKYLAMEKDYEAELALLQNKYEKQWFPLLAQRAEKLVKEPAAAGVGTPSIKNFWLTVLKKSDNFREVIEEHDEPVLASLQDIKFEWLDDQGKTGWKLHFHFVENEFFKNKVLTKIYRTQQTNEWDTSLEYTKIDLVEKIEWKEGKNVTVEVVAKKVKGGGKKKAKAKNKIGEVPRPSWFRQFFRSLGEDCELPTDCEDEDDEEEDDEEFDKMDMYIQDDVEDAEALRDQIIPHAVRYFTGEACDDDDDDDDDEDESDDEDEDDDDDDDDDETDEDEPTPKPSPKKGKGKAPKGGGAEVGPDGEPKQECKQQ